MNIKDMVNNDKKVFFRFYRDGNLWYTTETNFLFPVPIDEIGNATFNYEERAMLFMRYMRKHIKFIEENNEKV